MNILRQNVKLTDRGQKKYYESKVLPEYKRIYPELLLFSLLYRDKLVAYGGLTYIDWVSRRTELSFLADTKRIENKDTYRNDFAAFIKLVKGVAFHTLKLHRIYTETFDVRPHHVKILESSGFKYEGRLKEHVLVNGKYVDSLMHGMLKKYK